MLGTRRLAFTARVLAPPPKAVLESLHLLHSLTGNLSLFLMPSLTPPAALAALQPLGDARLLISCE